MRESDEIAIVYDWLRRKQGLTAGEADAILEGRAALRSDSPVSETTCRIHGTPLEERESQGGGVPGLVCVLCAEELHGASTGGERDEPPDSETDAIFADGFHAGKEAACKELEQTPGYIHGFNAGFDEAMEQEGAIPVNVEARAECDCCMAIHDAKHIQPGPYVLLPRQVEGDDPNGKEG